MPGRVDDYFDRLNQRLQKTSEPIATWRGELYLEYHRGTYTSQANVKQWNRRAEYALRDLELRYATAAVQKHLAYPTQAIRALWQILLRNQFHDILPGSAIHEVYEDAAKEFDQIFSGIKHLHQQLDDALLTKDEQAITVTNPLPWARTQLLPLQATDDCEFVAPNAATTAALSRVSVPALSSITVYRDDIEAEASGQLSTVDKDGVESPFYRIKYSQDGHLTQLYDRRLGKDMLSAVGGNLLTLYEDRPLDFNNWNIDADYPAKATPLHADRIVVTANTGTHTDVTFNYRFGHSTIMQVMRLYADSSRIDFITTVDWHQRQELLRTAFNTNILADNAQYDIQYGNVSRPTNDNTSWDTAKFETVAHKWADLSEPDYGLALLNNCKYGYRVKDKQLSLTLLKSGNDPDTTADEGQHSFTYSLLPHAGGFTAGQVEKNAEELNEPLRVTTGVTGPQLTPLFKFDHEQAALDAVKISEDGQYLIIRFHEFTGQHGQVDLQLNFNATAVYRGRLNETVASQTNLLSHNAVSLAVRPYEIVTLCVPFQPAKKSVTDSK